MKKILNFKLILLLFILSGVYITLFSESGYLERRKHGEKISELKKRVMDLKNENIRLNRLYTFYREGGLTEEDLLKAGYVKKGEKVIVVKGKLPENDDLKKPVTANTSFISMGNLRIAWIFISAMVLMAYFYSRTGKTGEKQ